MVSVDGDGELLVRETLEGEKSQASAEELSFVGSSVKAALVHAVQLAPTAGNTEARSSAKEHLSKG